MGKITAATCNFIHQDQIWKDYVRKELVVSKAWKKDWSFLTDKYKELEKKTEETRLTNRRSSLITSTKSEHLKLPQLQAPRQDTVPSFPQVTSHEIGWRSDRKFSLEVFGRWGRPKYSIINQLKWPNDAVP